MDFLDILGILLLAATGWLWLDSLKAREKALSEIKTLCLSEALLLLDDTLSIQNVSFGRDDEGVLRLRRRYSFEYRDTGNNRHPGYILMLGVEVLLLNLQRPPPLPANVISLFD